MTQFLKRFFYYPWRFFYRLVCWINYPTSRERMWHMYSLGKAQGRKEALKDLPIVQVQPRQTTKPVELHLPPGEWTRQWRETHSGFFIGWWYLQLLDCSVLVVGFSLQAC